ncbi:HNH endonuclease signature motif containing protein [Devosia sp. A449]
MPSRAPRICSCGNIVAHGVRCACQVARKARTDTRRPNATARGYDHAWRKARAEFLVLNPWCSWPGCNAPASVVDHIMAHRGNQALFWNRANWQALCAPCHNRHKQAQERAAP